MASVWLMPPGPAAAQAAGPQAVVDYLQAINGARFTPAEAARIVAVERRLAARDAAGRQRTWRAAATELRVLNGATPELRAYARHKARVAFQLAPQPNPTALRIVAAHDPVIVVDRPRKEAVTVADVRAMHASNAFIGKLTGVAPPASALTPAAVADIRTRYTGDAAVRQVLTEAQVRNTLRERYWARLPAKTKGQVIAEIRHAVRKPVDVATAARELEGAFANVFIKDLQRKRQAAIARAVFPNGPLAGLVAMKRATVNLDAINAAWPHI
ncbi:MAG: hypothetical protein PGN21_17165 [Sphingomonas paucimobilis]